MSGFREYVQKLRERGFVDTGNSPPYFPPITGDYKKDPANNEVRYVPGIISLVKSARNPLIQVDLCKFSNGDFSVRVTDARGERINYSNKVIFDSNGNPQDEKKAQALEAVLFRRKQEKAEVTMF